MIDVKICGLNDAAGVAAAVSGGARYVGFVFFAKSPRHVGLEQARGVAAAARGKADIVAVTVDADDQALEAISKALAPDWVQLHGRESVRRVGEAKRFARRGVIKALPVARKDDLAAAAEYAVVAEMLMFDAKAPEGADRPGGHGLAFDWTMLAGRTFPRPWLLSGGLNPENVAEAIRASGAQAVDVSSGVESAPGVKDAGRIAAFLAAAKGP